MPVYYDLLDTIHCHIKNHHMIMNYLNFACRLFFVYKFTASRENKPAKNQIVEDVPQTNIPDSPPEKFVKEFPGVYQFIFLLINIIFSKFHFYIHKKYKKKQNKYIKGFYFVLLYVLYPIFFMLSQLYFYIFFYPKQPLFHPKLYENLKV